MNATNSRTLCSNCGGRITDKSIICPECGTVFRERYPSFSDVTLEAEIDACIQKLSESIAQSHNLTKYAWEKEVERYAGIMSKVRQVLSNGTINAKSINIDTYIKNIDEFLYKCSNAEFQIALIGAVKAGKSTLMNAITGCEAASTAVTPETASLTKFRSSGSSENYVNVKFYKQSEWDKLWSSVRDKNSTVFVKEYNDLNADSVKNQWLNHEPIKMHFTDFSKFTDEIQKWTSAKRPEHYFVDEVEIGLATLDMPPEVVFVDTPGLDDPVEYRSKITQNYIKSADAVVVCVKADSLRGTELATIANVFSYSRTNPNKVYISATQCDRLNHPNKDWQALNELWIRHLEQSQYYNSKELAMHNIIPTAAGLHNLISKLEDCNYRKNLDEEAEGDALSMLFKYKCRSLDNFDNPQEVLALYERTGVDTIKTRLQTEVIDRRKLIAAKEIKAKYDICTEEIKNAMLKEISVNIDSINNLKKSRDELMKLGEYNKSQLESFKTEKENRKAELENMSQRTRQLMNELIMSIKNMSSNDNDDDDE